MLSLMRVFYALKFNFFRLLPTFDPQLLRLTLNYRKNFFFSRSDYMQIHLITVTMETTIVSLDNNCIEIRSHRFIPQPLIIPKQSYFKLPSKINRNSSNKRKHFDSLSRSCSFSHHHARNKAITTRRSFSFKIDRHLQVCFISPYSSISSNLLIAC